MYVDGVFSPLPDFADDFFPVPKRSSKSSPSPSSDGLLEPEDAGFAMAGSGRLPEFERGDSALLRVPEPDSRGLGLAFATASLGVGGAGVAAGGDGGVAAGVPPAATPAAGTGAGVAAAPGGG
jgi:hypothetical protein